MANARRLTSRPERWTALVFSAVLVAVSIAQGQDEVFTPNHVARLRYATSAEISPDGVWIAYTLSVPRRPFVDDNGPAYSELHVVDMEGHDRPFITGKVNVSSIQWTPDGKGIAFRMKRGDDKHTALYVIPVDGGEARKVLEFDTGVGDYSFSPDGLQVAFLAKDKEPKEDKDLKEDGFNAEVYEEDWRPTKVRIARPRFRDDAWADDDEADEDEADEDEPRVLALEGSAHAVRWSPTGKHLAVTLAPTPLVDDRYMKNKVHIVDVETGESIGMLETPGKIGQFVWSPDGEHVAVVAAGDIHDPEPGRIAIGSVKAGAVSFLLNDYLGHVTSLAWQDNDTLMYLADEGVWSTLAKIDIDGGNAKTILPPGKAVLSRLRLRRDGSSAVMLQQSDRHPNEIATMAHSDAAPRVLTDNNPWLANMRFAKQEPISYEARDGLRIEGVLIRPLNEKPGKHYPLILTVHGGPEAHETNGWKTYYSRPGQVGAARGFAVFYPNYRGSTGRGVAFSKLDQADYAGAEFDDLVDGADYLVSTGLVDEKRVGVTGGSYGGFAAAWCATALSEHFAAAVMFVGISDQISKFGTTDIPNEMYLVHARKWPWEDWAFFRERSPLMHFKKGRTPILILGGKDDTRVPPSQSMELYRYLKTWGKVPVRLIRYPGEGHGNRKASARMDYNLRMLRWFETYLKGKRGPIPPSKLDYSEVKPESSDSDDDKGADDDGGDGT